MARTSITTARYNPFTMEELYSPVLRATEQHLKQQEKYDELANQASVWKYRIDSNSPEALQAYNDYMVNLDTAVNDLYENGINSPSARDNARNLIRNNPLHAFDEAYKRQVADNELRMKLGPDAIYVQENPTFDDYLKGTVNNTYQSADDVLKTSALVGTNLAKSITENPKYSSILGGQYWQEVQKNGIPPQVYYAVQSGDKSNLSGQDLALYDALDNAVNNVKDQIGYNNFASNPNALNKLDAAIWNGMSAGLQTKKYNNEANRGYIDPIRAEEHRWKKEDRAIEQEDRDRIERLSNGKGTEADKWWARSKGFDPETGAKVSSRASSSAGKTTSRVMSYIPQTISLDAKGNVTGRGDKSIDETISSDKTYHTVPFKELSKGQQTQVLTQMGYTKEEINAMYKEVHAQSIQPSFAKYPIVTNIQKFIGNAELDPEVLSSSLTIYVKDNTKKPGKESDAGIIIRPNNYQTSANFLNNYINENLLGNMLYELGETSNPTVETAGYDEDVQSSVDSDLQ